jgi:hypothetical protein
MESWTANAAQYAGTPPRRSSLTWLPKLEMIATEGKGEKTVRAPERVRKYFRAIRSGLLGAAEEAVCNHSGLTGGHRETVCKEYLGKVLPKRFDVDRGMVYGFAHRSKEADIVIWDSMNFPRLDMPDHTVFFAESVRAVLEVKTRLLRLLPHSTPLWGI